MPLKATHGGVDALQARGVNDDPTGHDVESGHVGALPDCRTVASLVTANWTWLKGIA